MSAPTQPSETPSAANQPKQRPRRVANNVLDVASLHGLLHRTMETGSDRHKIFASVRDILIEATGAVGAGMIARDEQSTWSMTSDHVSGRIPTRPDFVQKFGKSSETAIARGCTQMERLLGLEAIYVPLKSSDGPIVLIVLVRSEQTAETLFALEIASVYLNLFLAAEQSRSSDWKTASLAAIIDLVSRIEQQSDQTSACHLVANELARHLGVSAAAVGTVTDGRLVVRAISGTSKLQKGSETFRAIEMTLSECLLREKRGVYPPVDSEQSHLLIAHRQYCRQEDVEAVLTVPLKPSEANGDADCSGAIMVTGDKALLHSNQLAYFLDTSAPSIASALEIARRAQRHWLPSRLDQAVNYAKTRRGVSWALAALLLVAVMLVPIRYRVRCGCHTEPLIRRFAVAPFEGQIDKGFVEQGDVVREGDLLAKMDGKSIRFERASLMAEQQQAAKKREIELAQRNVTQSLLSQLEAQRLASQAELLRHQLEQLEIRAPIDGVVLSGSAQQADASAVDTGDVVYELGAMHKMRVEVAVPAEEVAHVAVGQSVRIWFDGLSGKSFTATLERVRPESELRDGRNMFIATITLDNQDDLLRPGMKGKVRIDCDKHSLAWTLFHSPWDFLVSRLTWW